MQHLQFVTDYKKEDPLRTSFFALAADTFGLELESWYQEGFWDGRYIPFSYADGDRIVANVSVNLLDLVIDGNTVQAIQLGTVMTHPDYRRQGLSAALMEKVLEEYSSRCELMYLFANDSVLDFYPRFGFRPAGQELHLFDVISRREPDIHSILSKLADSGTTQIVFHYTPDYSGLEMSSTPYDSGLFVKTGSGFAFPEGIKHPATSIA